MSETMRFAFYSPNKLIRTIPTGATAQHRFGQLMPTLPNADFAFGRAGIALCLLSFTRFWGSVRLEQSWNT
jgi:hypothetical protein